MNQLKRFKILEACNYLLENLPSKQTNDIYKIWINLKYKEDEELVLPYYKKCNYCNNIKPIDLFIYYSNSNTKKCESDNCDHCRDIIDATNGIKQSLRNLDEINSMFNLYDEEGYKIYDAFCEREDYIESIIDNLPKEYIELKVLINKSQKKLKNVTSKH